MMMSVGIAIKLDDTNVAATLECPLRVIAAAHVPPSVLGDLQDENSRATDLQASFRISHEGGSGLSATHLRLVGSLIVAVSRVPAAGSAYPQNCVNHNGVLAKCRTIFSVRPVSIAAEDFPKWTFDLDEWPAGITRLETTP